ncbi:MAG TPA: ABC transporter substrate-binding protein [Xanthobacteraceae bacterium]|jgi:branched-chain amino acid transport system substrate-binding protein
MKMMGAAVVASTLLAAAVPAQADVVIGILVPSSGKGASYGQQQQNAINMFVEKYAAVGGPAGKMKLVIYDTRGENTDAINLTRKLIDSDQVAAIVGPQFSAEAEVAFPLAVRGETPMVTPMAAKAGIAAANRPWAFRFALTTENVYRPLIDIWLKQQSSPIKRVVIFMDAKDAVSSFDGKTVFPKLLKEHGIESLDTVSFQTGDIDYSAQVTRAKALNPDGLVVSALYNEAGHAVAEIRKQGMKQPIIAGVGINDPRFIQIGGAATEGVLTGSDFFAANPEPKVAAWVSDYEKRYNQKPSNASAEMYDTLYLMRECIRSTGIDGSNVKADRVKLRDCWSNMKGAAAPLMGATSIDKNGDGTRIPAVLEVKGGNFVVAQ